MLKVCGRVLKGLAGVAECSRKLGQHGDTVGTRYLKIIFGGVLDDVLLLHLRFRLHDRFPGWKNTG